MFSKGSLSVEEKSICEQMEMITVQGQEMFQFFVLAMADVRP